MTFRTRFAPSPTGYLHLGHAFSALTAHAYAMRAGGQFILRIEDIDQGRCRPEFTQAIYEDLAWLGLGWERPARIQSQQIGDYHAALARLRDMRLVYRRFKTRKDLAADEVCSRLSIALLQLLQQRYAAGLLQALPLLQQRYTVGYR